MIGHMAEPMAWADVTWRAAAEGGRKSGPPTAPVYAANCAFPLGEDADLVPGWPATAEKFSLLLEKRSVNDDGSWMCAVDFLARDLVAEYVLPGQLVLVMEGPKVVGEATITRVETTEN